MSRVPVALFVGEREITVVSMTSSMILLPPAWTGLTIRQRVAHAEYKAASDPSRRIPEQRIADV